MVKKKDRTWRMCVDYRRINKTTKFDCLPFPRLDEALDDFASSTVSFSLDLVMAYHLVFVAFSGVRKTAFITHVGLYKMVKMPFGLCNASSTYQRLMLSVLQGLISRTWCAYLDYVIVFSRCLTIHLDNLCTVFTRILGAGLSSNRRNVNSFGTKCFYLGHIINASGVFPDPAELRVLVTCPIQTTVGDVQSFLVFVNFYGEYIAGLTPLTASLYGLTVGREGTEKVVLDAE